MKSCSADNVRPGSAAVDAPDGATDIRWLPNYIKAFGVVGGMSLLWRMMCLDRANRAEQHRSLHLDAGPCGGPCCTTRPRIKMCATLASRPIGGPGTRSSRRSAMRKGSIFVLDFIGRIG